MVPAEIHPAYRSVHTSIYRGHDIGEEHCDIEPAIMRKLSKTETEMHTGAAFLL
jgi:hypothetical protein